MYIIWKKVSGILANCGIVSEKIKAEFANSGMSTLSGFVRAMIFEGYIVHIDENKLKRLNVLASNIANNIN